MTEPNQSSHYFSIDLTPSSCYSEVEAMSPDLTIEKILRIVSHSQQDFLEQAFLLSQHKDQICKLL